MLRTTMIILVLAAACAPSGAPPLTRAPDYTTREIREPALFVRVAEGDGLGEADRESLAARYEGSLVEAFDARGVPPTDVQRVPARARVDPRQALARAREVRADYAVIVDLQLERRDAIVCRGRRPFMVATTVWSQGVQVLRTRDGTARMAVPPGQGLDLTEIEPDCANPRQSRLRDRTEMIASAVEAVVERILGP